MRECQWTVSESTAEAAPVRVVVHLQAHPPGVQGWRVSSKPGQIIADLVCNHNGHTPASPRRSARICIVASICSPLTYISALVELELPLLTAFCVCLRQRRPPMLRLSNPASSFLGLGYLQK